MGDRPGHVFHGNQYTDVGGVDQARIDKMSTRRHEFQKLAGGIGNPTKWPDGTYLTNAQREAAIVLGHTTRNEHTAEFLTLASQIEEKYGTPAMLEAMGSTATWYQSPSSALSDWEASKALGGAPGSPGIEAAMGVARQPRVDWGGAKLEGEQAAEYEKLILKEIGKGSTPADAIGKANKKFGVEGDKLAVRSENFAPREHKPIDPATVGAFEMRQQAAQRAFREKFGADEVEVFRGVGGKQGSSAMKDVDALRQKELPERVAAGNASVETLAKKMNLTREQIESSGNETLQKMAREAYEKGFLEAASGPPDKRLVDLGVRGLSSWTTSQSDAAEFAGAKGAVLKTKVTAKDVWHFTGGPGARGVIRYMEDADEIVIHSKTPTRTVAVIGAGRKPRKRMGGFW